MSEQQLLATMFPLKSMRRRKATLRNLGNEKHSGTKIHVIGPGTTAIANHIIRNTEVGGRDPDGGNDTITLGRSYEEECNLGDKCKYLNINVACGPRQADGTSQYLGWVEWAVTMNKESDPLPTNSNLGTQTLGDVMTKYLRNECILTGTIPIGLNQCNNHAISIKVPSTKIALKTGDTWRIWFYARTISATETATDTFKVMSSYNFKNYH